MHGRRLLAIVCLWAGCGTAEPVGSTEHALVPSDAVIAVEGTAVVADEVAVEAVAIEEGAVEEVVLDQHADGARLVGRVEPVPPDSDADRVIVLRVVAGDGTCAPGLEGARVTDARFVGDDVVTIGADRVLRLHAQGGQVAELDTEAYEPLSVAGSQVAYVRGEMPFFEVARADVRTGVVAAVTSGMAPAWSPALTPDGSAIVFVSGAEGAPRLYRVQGSGAPRALAPSARTPSSPIAPRFVTEPGHGEVLVFEDEQGRVWLDLAQGQVVRTAEVAR